MAELDDAILAQFLMTYQNVQSSIEADEEARSISERGKRKNDRFECPTVRRERKTLSQVYRELGHAYFRRSFRMTFSVFGRLFKLLVPYMKEFVSDDDKNHSPNGPITLTVRLACGIRFFAGRDAYDIACMFGISHSSVFENIDIVIESINNCDALKIEFPSDHDEQRKIADGFLRKSPDAQFANCVWCIDGILI